MCFYIDEWCEVYNEVERKARKDHRCDSCRRTIRRGEFYCYASGIHEGPFTAKYCGACELDRYRIHIHELGEGCFWSESWCPPEELLNYISDTDMERATPEEGQRFLGYRNRRRDQYNAVYKDRQ